MAEPTKNTFDFGTGSIDKDQWLRDIDAEQDEFISRYAGAVNKHRAALIRQAFSDLRGRIANGDMLNRTADGNYQFGSALNREDKHMQEAYQRALGFMGQLARRQLTPPAPAAEPEKKKIGSLEERYIRSLNPSGKLNTKAYWDNQTDDQRRESLTSFLNKELQEAGNYNDFEGFGTSDEYKKRLNTVLGLLNSKTANDYSLQQLGFTQNWLTKPKDEEETEEKAKTDLEQVQADIAAAQEAQQVTQGRQYLSYNANRGTTDFNLNVPTYDFNKALQNYLSEALSDTQLRQAAAFNPNFNPSKARAEQARNYVAQQQQNLNNYFANFATSWRSNYESGQANRNVMQNYLSRLFATYNKGTNQDGTPITDYAYDWKKYFTQIGDNQFLINGSLDRNTGRYAYYVPGQGIRESNVLDTSNPYIAQQLGYTIPSQKEGGKIEFLQQGGGFDYAAWEQANTPKPVQKPAPKKETKEENSQFSNSETARIAATIADITSMGAAFVPGYGTAASAVLGLGSTATNFGADLADGAGLWNATKNAGFGLAADVMGLIPGLGGVGKGAKIARNLMWAVPKMMQWVNTVNGLANAGEIKNSIMKLTSPSSMSVQDWQNVSQALQIMTGHGRSVATKVKKAGMIKTTTTTEPEHYIYTNKGKQKVSDETFKKLRETRGTKARQALTEELMGQGVTLNQTRFAPWNTSTRFGAFKEVPGRTTIEVQNKHKGWFSDENLVQKAENANPSVDIRGILTRINPYKAYYSGRNQPVIPKRDYSKLYIFPADSPLNIHNITSKVQPYPTGEKYAARPIEQPKAQPNPQSKKKHKRRKHEIGGILYALRNGGIIKAVKGVKLSSNAGTWYNDIFSGYGDTIINRLKSLEGKDRQAAVDWLNGMQDQHSQMYTKYTKAGNNFNDQASGDYTTHAYQVAYNQGNGFTTKPGGFNTLGIQPHYGTRYDFGGIPRNTGDNVNQNWGPDGYYSQITDDRRILGRLDDWTPEQLSAFNEKLKELGYVMDNNYDDKYYRIKPLDGAAQASSPTNPNDTILQEMAAQAKPGDMGGEGTGDTETGRDTVVSTKLKNPFDPTPLIVAGKTIQGLIGNRDIYGNLLKEMPQAPLRDPIDRKLAIVGWQERIKHGQNELADLRRVQQRQQGADQQTNFATALETERVGRDVMDKAFMEDSGRQFETAGKSWNIDNEDYLYNIKVGDDNRKAIADRARMMAQIRAAWRSGDNNILMGALADTGNWWLKKYQREQDLVDKAKELELGSPEERAQSDLYGNDPKYAALMDKYQSGQALTDEERAYVRSAQAKALRNIRGNYAQAYYNMYHTPWFGGGYKAVLEVKDGTKLEVAKLKARGRDNDRYVSMIKDLRPSRRRRRR